MLLRAHTFTHVFTGVLLSLQNWQASVKSREEEEEEEKKKSNIGSQGCAAARGRQPKSIILEITKYGSSMYGYELLITNAY